MAKNGFRILDSDMHIMEPPDLWERYIDAKFKARAPRGVTSHNVRDLRLVHPDGKEVIANNVIEQAGNGHLVFSTEYSRVDSRYPEAVNHFLRLPLSDADKRKVFWDNCASYYAM